MDKEKVRKIACEYADRVTQAYKPKSVILFGSYVNGTPQSHSDIDIAVIFDSFEGDWLAAWADLVGIACDVDVLAGIEPHLLDEICNRSGFLDHIRRTGEVVYEALR